MISGFWLYIISRSLGLDEGLCLLYLFPLACVTCVWFCCWFLFLAPASVTFLNDHSPGVCEFCLILSFYSGYSSQEISSALHTECASFGSACTFQRIPSLMSVTFSSHTHIQYNKWTINKSSWCQRDGFWSHLITALFNPKSPLSEI